MVQIRILGEAARELAQLDPSVARRVVSRIRWLANHLEEIQPEALAGEYAGLFKLRIGDYRVLYEILHAEHTLVVHLIGHRREIYDRPQQHCPQTTPRLVDRVENSPSSPYTQ